MDRSILVKNEECLQTLEGHSNWLTSSVCMIFVVQNQYVISPIWFRFSFLIFKNKKRASVMCFQEDFNEDRIVFVCFVCAREELTGERLLLRKEGNEFRKL